MATGYCFDEAGMWHDTGSYSGWMPASFNPREKQLVQPFRHFENAEAKRRCHSLAAACGLLSSSTIKLLPHALGEQYRVAGDEDLLLVHTQRHIDEVEDASRRSGSSNIGECTVVGSGSALIARRAVGSALQAADAVLDGTVRNAYVLCRPPGHHAEPDLARGFCLFNNAAIVAAHLLTRRSISRIAVVDFDVHHGNGTEKAFYADSRVLVVSVHQDSLYPLESGRIDASGIGAGVGCNINIPVPPGSGVGCYDAVLERVICPALRRFNPEFVLVSAGYDACAFDPLSHTMLSSSSYTRLMRGIMDAVSGTKTACGGRILALHEGGYSDVYAPYCMLRVLEALAGVEESSVEDPYEEEIAHYSYQALQPAQELIVAQAEKLVCLVPSHEAP